MPYVWMDHTTKLPRPKRQAVWKEGDEAGESVPKKTRRAKTTEQKQKANQNRNKRRSAARSREPEAVAQAGARRKVRKTSAKYALKAPVLKSNFRPKPTQWSGPRYKEDHYVFTIDDVRKMVDDGWTLLGWEGG